MHKNNNKSDDENIIVATKLICQGKLKEAENICLEVLKVNPNSFSALNNLGQISLRLNLFDRALFFFKQALENNPNDGQLLFYIGTSYYFLKDFDKAIIAFQESIKVTPNVAIVYYNLAMAFKSQGEYERALINFKKALCLDKKNPHILYNIGNTYKCINKPTDAIEAFIKAIKLHPNYKEAYFNLGVTYDNFNQKDKAIQIFKEAIEIDEKYLDPWLALAKLYEKKSNFAEALLCIDRAQEIAPGNPESIRLKALILRRQGKIEEALTELESIDWSLAQKRTGMRIHFELGKLYDRGGDFDKAFHHFLEGNTIQKQTEEAQFFTKEKSISLVKNYRQGLTTELADSIQKKRIQGKQTNLIFLIGFSRSGTTLVGQIIDSHPMFDVMDEKPPLYHVIENIPCNDANYTKILPELTSQQISSLRSIYLNNAEQFVRLKADKFLVDKNPFHINHIALIQKIFPEAKIILTIRHPYDVCLSNFMQSFELNNIMANFFTIEDTAYYYDLVMSSWMKYDKLIQPDHHLVKYEDLVNSFEKEMKAMLDYLEAPWSDSLIDFHSHASKRQDIETPSYEQVTQPLYKSAVYRWKSYEKYFSSVTKILDPYCEHFAYK